MAVGGLASVLMEDDQSENGKQIVVDIEKTWAECKDALEGKRG